MSKSEYGKTKLFCLTGILACLMTMTGDYLLEQTAGFGGEKTGAFGFIETGWANMPKEHFVVSLWLGIFAVPLMLAGAWGVRRFQASADCRWADRVWAVFACGIAGGGFVHTIMSILPLIYKAGLRGGPETAAAVVNSVTGPIFIPLFCFYFLMTLGQPLVILASIIKKKSAFKIWQLFFSPIPFILIGILAVKLWGSRGQFLLVGSASRGLMMPYVFAFLGAKRPKK